MRKLGKQLVICAMITASVWVGVLITQGQQLKENLIRFHVVANSDAPEDQAVKLQVRDAVLESIREDLQKVADVEEAKAYLQENLPKIEAVANRTLEAAGFSDTAVVKLCREAFDTRNYDTFSLPAGVYEALRITIGEGAGHNWWCVAFPDLCQGATTREFTQTAAQAGLPEDLTETLASPQPRHIRFYLLDVLGQVQNYFFEK